MEHLIKQQRLPKSQTVGHHSTVITRRTWTLSTLGVMLIQTQAAAKQVNIKIPLRD